MPSLIRSATKELSLVILGALLLLVVIGWADEASGWELSLFVFYALPIALVVWKVNRGTGFAFALLSMLVWWLANQEENPYHTDWGYLVATASRGFYFLTAAVACAAVKAQHDLDGARIEALERTQQLEREIVRTSENEKQRIGRDVHDSLGPQLAAIGFAAKLLADDLRSARPVEAAKADEIGGLLKESLNIARTIARGLSPVQMEESGLAMALEDMAARTSRLTPVSVLFDETKEVRVSDPEAAMHLFRIAQEAITNVVKHSGATHAVIGLDETEKYLELTVSDNGKGLTNTTGQHEGIGLRTMQYRARALGGQIEFRSEPDSGTVVLCRVPIQSVQGNRKS